MSSDSDLDFESADEDTNYDVHTKNNNPSRKKHVEECDNKEPEICNMSPESKLNTADSCEKSVNENQESNNKTEDTDSNKRDETKSSNFSSQENQIEEQIHEVLSVGKKVTTEYEDNCKNEHRTSNDSVDAQANKSQQEKQRVTLRLEKKIQQKNQMLKESSVEKESSFFHSENRQKQQDVKASSWGFGNWGTSLLSTAASSVSTFTNQVSQGIESVLETVENTLGAPPPEELAVTLKEKKESDTPLPVNETEGEKSDEVKEVNKESSEVRSSILPNVSSWTKVLENTGSKVIMGGLDTLELIGKKTIDIITEGDPGLRKKRAAFAEGITLSQILREAKAEADESKQDNDSQGFETIHYSQLFDEYQGLVHLEALEMLSKQSQVKIQRLLMGVARAAEVRKNMEEIKSICENIPPLDDPTDCEDFEDFVTVCKKYVLELNLPFNVESIVKAQQRITDVVKSYENVTVTTSTPEEIYQSAICCLAEFTAKSIETFHKMAELILVQPTLEPSVEHFATNLTGLTTIMCIEINNLSSRFHRCLDSMAEQSEDSSSQKTNNTTIVTNLYLEASNSNKYIQDAFLLLVPVLQVYLIESSQ